MKLDIKKKGKKSLSLGLGTITIFAINVAFFILLKTIPEIAEDILLNPRIDFILSKPWTLVTVFFSNENLIHFTANMGLFLAFGKVLEEITNAKTVILVYLTAGFVGSLTFVPFAPMIQWTGTVIGASAATWGVVSAFAVMRPNYWFFEGSSKVSKVLFGGSVKVLAILLFIFNIIIFVINPTMSIGAAAHAAGLIVGVIWGYILKSKEVEIK